MCAWIDVYIAKGKTNGPNIYSSPCIFALFSPSVLFLRYILATKPKKFTKTGDKNGFND